MFSSTGLFKNIPCPNKGTCTLANCFFSHEQAGQSSGNLSTSVPAFGSVIFSGSSDAGNDPKRRRLEDGRKDVPRPSVASSQSTPEKKLGDVPVVDDLRETRVQPLGTERKKSDAKADNVPFVGQLVNGRRSETSDAKRPSNARLSTASRPISPPPVKARPKPGSNVPPAKIETLSPRMVANGPAGFAKRKLYLDALHGAMKKLNDEVVASQDPNIKILLLTDRELVTLALDEEERFATEQPSVYENMIKLRILACSKKMKLEGWVTFRRESIAKTNPPAANTKNEPSPIDTGLTTEQEIVLLGRIIANQQGLEHHGYVTSPPTEEAIRKAVDAVEMCKNFESCDRCSTRFQAFPDRREDGALTSGGKCTFHPGKPFQPKKERGDATKGPLEKHYGCCQQPIGTKGCETAPTHVFKTSDPKRLAAVTSFIRTPENPTVGADKPVCFDCEMGYTSYGLELIRLTATSWPKGRVILDVLVRPRGTILDLNSRYSGVTPEHIMNAVEYVPTTTDQAVLKKEILGLRKAKISNANDQSHLQTRIVPDTATARMLLLAFLSPETPLIGHALENDLNAVRLVHPSIVDTILLYPHPKGLPLRFGLKSLVAKYLERAIQTAGLAGHDSAEDANAAGDLARFKIGKLWKQLSMDGWLWEDGKLKSTKVDWDAAAAKAGNAEKGDQNSLTKKRKLEETLAEE
ncbi:hypothetical protein K402DRAFT_153507 [Aulographum hederae CBS 113979]|uniref:Exonuclease domain-containing protein n=1 Tax=Aulographum hederae CBS 113979 TaxID=1176131 RepID=A0A6G1GT79_9PEZI|nr:hypothetical protein K402DRAFT_153507 [Aulographum hederae CBS 113979]